MPTNPNGGPVVSFNPGNFLQTPGMQGSNPWYNWGGMNPNTYGQDRNGLPVAMGAMQDVGRYQGLAAQARGAAAPQANYGQANGYLDMGLGARQSQADALDMQRRAAMGQMPSVAQAQMQQGLGQAFANQQALASGARGAGAMGVAQASAANAMAGQQANVVGQTGALRAQEMAQARDAYMQGASGIRAQDYGAAGMAGGWAQNQAALQAQQNALNAQTGLGYEHLGYDVNAAQLQASMNQVAAANQQWQAQQNVSEQSQQDQFNNGMRIGGAIVTGGAGML